MASTVSLYDYYLYNGMVVRLPLNSTQIISHNNNNTGNNTVENVRFLQRTSEEQGRETNGNNIGDRWPTSSLSAAASQYATPRSTFNFTPQQYNQTAGSTSISMAPQQQQYRFNQQQHQQQQQRFNFNGQSHSITAPENGNTQYQQYYKSYAFQQNNYPSTNLIYNNSGVYTASLTQPPNQNQLEHLQCQQQQQQRQTLAVGTTSIDRPWIIWFIGWVDILFGVLFTVWAVYNIFTKPISDPDTYIWHFFIGFVAILIRFLMGFGLLTGLKSDDDSSTLWYCKLWIIFQLLFIICNIIEVMITLLLYASRSRMLDPNGTGEFPVSVSINVGILVYRFVCFIMVRQFAAKLKRSEAMPLPLPNANAYLEQQQARTMTDEESDEERRNKDGTGEGTFGLPYASFLLSVL